MSIYKTLIDNNNHDIEQLILPQLTGVTGPTGATGSINLPTAAIGSLAFQRSNNQVYVSTGSAWQAILSGKPVLNPTITFVSDINGAINATGAFTVTASPIGTSIMALTIKSALTANCGATGNINLVTTLPSGYYPTGQTMVAPCDINYGLGGTGSAFYPCTFSVSTSGLMVLKPLNSPFNSTDTSVILLNYFIVYMLV